MFGFLEMEIVNARRAANLSPEKIAVMELVPDKCYMSWDGVRGNMTLGKITPTQVLNWDVPSEEADRLLNVDRWMPSFTQSKAEKAWLDIKDWFGRRFGIDAYRDREWVYLGEFLEGENLVELRGLIANLEREGEAS